MRIGIDVGGTTTEGVLLAGDGTIVAALAAPTPRGAGIADAVVGMVRALAGRSEGDAARSVGIGIPGLVDTGTGEVREALNLDVRRLALGSLVAHAVGLPVRVDNDVKATALGAAAWLGDRGASLGYLNIGTGVAAAAVERGFVLRGLHNSAGEIGHLIVRDDGPRCACGARGCVEALVGGRALGARLAAMNPAVGLEDLFRVPYPPASLLAEQTSASRGLAAAIRAIGLLWGSETIVLGGGVVRHATGLVDAAVVALRREARSSSLLAALHLPERLVVAPTDRPLAAIGAANLVPESEAIGGPR